jgi:two-component system sensor histidine kinase MtrB
MGTSVGARLRRALRAVAHTLRDLPARWRRSLQFRVISVTMVLSLIVAVGLGYFIAHLVADGILRTRVEAAKEQARAGFESAQQDFSAQNVDPTIDTSVVATSVARSLCHGSQFQVVVIAQKSTEKTGAFPAACIPLQPNTLPQNLLDAVQNGAPGTISSVFATVNYDTEPATRADAIIYGARVNVNNSGTEFVAQIYYVFPLTQDEQNLQLVELSLVIAGFILVLALVAIAWFVARQVVMPVRMAAGIAERLAAGRLEERMRVRGEDDLASLATSFNKMAANLQSQIRRLEELSRVQRRFVSDVSHELRTPLTTVRMAADLIHEERDSFETAVARSAELLQNQLDRFEELLDDLLEISRFDAGAAILDAEPVDLRALVHRVVDSSAPLADRKGSEVVVRAPDEPAVAEVDARRIDRVLRNLVINAIEHGEGQEVVITVAASEDAVAVAVRDHGVGLRPGESSLVFNRFWRADPARARTTGGTGLGLAIALEDARLHHGWLQAWGEPGGGSQFRLTVPRSPRVELLRSPIPLEPEDSRHHLRQRRGAVSAPPVRTGQRHPLQLDRDMPPTHTLSDNASSDPLTSFGSAEVRDVIGSDSRGTGEQQ